MKFNRPGTIGTVGRVGSIFRSLCILDYRRDFASRLSPELAPTDLRTAHEAVDRVARAIVQHKTRVIDIDLSSYFDNVRHDRLLAKVAERVDDGDVMRLLKVMLKANGKQGVPQGGVISPLLSNLYLTEVDRMLERAKEATRYGKYTAFPTSFAPRSDCCIVRRHVQPLQRDNPEPQLELPLRVDSGHSVRGDRSTTSSNTTGRRAEGA